MCFWASGLQYEGGDSLDVVGVTGNMRKGTPGGETLMKGNVECLV